MSRQLPMPNEELVSGEASENEEGPETALDSEAPEFLDSDSDDLEISAAGALILNGDLVPNIGPFPAFQNEGFRDTPIPQFGVLRRGTPELDSPRYSPNLSSDEEYLYEDGDSETDYENQEPELQVAEELAFAHAALVEGAPEAINDPENLAQDDDGPKELREDEEDNYPNPNAASPQPSSLQQQHERFKYK